ncbi:rhodanese-like domain-containing protein [Halomicrococcus gelatinilyticus]|uniref:rhodanese-like domain-containing protein n=1 Tax=Halomicrococcus gelatinilyticus TaxID=1702103 RepID=UPI002E12006C
MDGEIAPAEVYELLEDGEDVRVVDIRSEAEFETGHVPGSECIPFHALPGRIDELDGASYVVTVCPHGKSSVQAARLIGSYEGVPDDARVESMAGGLDAWDHELESDADVASSDEPTSDAASDAPF